MSEVIFKAVVLEFKMLTVPLLVLEAHPSLVPSFELQYTTVWSALLTVFSEFRH